MKTVGNTVQLALALAALLSTGCARHIRTPLTREEPPARTGPVWGPEAEGLQCRLRPTKRLWNPGETLVFKLDLRNQGTRLFAFDASEPIRADRIAVDNRWYRWPRPDTVAATIRPLAPGVELHDLTLALPPTLQLPLDTGRHDIRVAFVLEGVEVRSTAIPIEISTAP